MKYSAPLNELDYLKSLPIAPLPGHRRSRWSREQMPRMGGNGGVLGIPTLGGAARIPEQRVDEVIPVKTSTTDSAPEPTKVVRPDLDSSP